MLSQRGDLTLEDNCICMRVSENSAREMLQKVSFVQGLCFPNPNAIAITDKENSKPTNIKGKQSLLHYLTHI